MVNLLQKVGSHLSVLGQITGTRVLGYSTGTPVPGHFTALPNHGGSLSSVQEELSARSSLAAMCSGVSSSLLCTGIF